MGETHGVSRRNFLKKVPVYFIGGVQAAVSECLKPFRHDAGPGGSLQEEETGVRLAALDRALCLAWEGTGCQLCYVACPLREVAIRMEDQRPVIIPSLCNGCAECVVACRTVNDPPALEMVPAS